MKNNLVQSKEKKRDGKDMNDVINNDKKNDIK